MKGVLKVTKSREKVACLGLHQLIANVSAAWMQTFAYLCIQQTWSNISILLE